MKKPIIRKTPEADIQDRIEKMLRLYGWFVKRTHGDMFQAGFPDIFASHYQYGMRWIEVKLPDMRGSHFTAAQLEIFPQMCANGAGVWILTGDTEDDYKKLFMPSNLYFYLALKL